MSAIETKYVVVTPVRDEEEFLSIDDSKRSWADVASDRVGDCGRWVQRQYG